MIAIRKAKEVFKYQAAIGKISTTLTIRAALTIPDGVRTINNFGVILKVRVPVSYWGSCPVNCLGVRITKQFSFLHEIVKFLYEASPLIRPLVLNKRECPEDVFREHPIERLMFNLVDQLQPLRERVQEEEGKREKERRDGGYDN